MVALAAQFRQHAAGSVLAVMFAIFHPLAAPAAETQSGAPTVTLRQTIITGVAADGIARFSGIRYALAPSGRRRWRPPVAFRLAAGPYDATRPGSACPQGATPWGRPSQNEDCLFLNVYTPGSGARHAVGASQQALPVMVWIHGGGFMSGEGAVYDASRLSRLGHVVVVTINYRLGALGEMAHPALDGEGHPFGNYGLLDQQLALRWIRRNIASFGGDPANVTLFGESSGAIDIAGHLTSPASASLFQKAILQSGAPASIPLSRAEDGGRALATKVGCRRPEPKAEAACLRSVTVQRLLAVQALPLAVIEDGNIIPRSVLKSFSDGRFAHVPIINGTNREEGNLIAAFMFDLKAGPLRPDAYVEALGAIGGFIPAVGFDASQVSAVAASYPSSSRGGPDLAAAAVITDGLIACPAHALDETISKFAPVHAYEFADETAPEIVAPPVGFPYRATHFSELQYLFDLRSIARPGSPGLTPQQLALSRQMIGYWTAFARTADPDGQDRPEWRRFGSSSPHPVLALETPQPRSFDRFADEHHCAFWDGLAKH